MKRISNSLVSLVLVTAFAMGSLAALIAAVWFVNEARADTDIALAAASANAAQAGTLEANATLSVRTATAREELTRVILPAGGGDAAFISEVESLGDKSHVMLTVQSIAAQPPRDNKPGSLTLSLGVVGSFSSIRHFLQLLETEPVALSIAKVSWSQDSSDKVWSASMSVSVSSFDSP